MLSNFLRRFAIALATTATALSQTPPAKEKTDWPEHSMDRPRPPVVMPKYDGKPVPPPAGAEVLFDGRSLDSWKSGPEKAKWEVKRGAMVVVAGTGSLSCQIPLKGDGLLHIEWATPDEGEGDGQGRGNSGVFIEGFPEIQVLDSFKNDTYPDGQAAALYGKHPPLANASAKPGKWQSYDIVIRNGDTTLLSVTHNGVLVQDSVECGGRKESRLLSLQEHGNPIRFRNIWFKPGP